MARVFLGVPFILWIVWIGLLAAECGNGRLPENYCLPFEVSSLSNDLPFSITGAFSMYLVVVGLGLLIFRRWISAVFALLLFVGEGFVISCVSRWGLQLP